MSLHVLARRPPALPQYNTIYSLEYPFHDEWTTAFVTPFCLTWMGVGRRSSVEVEMKALRWVATRGATTLMISTEQCRWCIGRGCADDYDCGWGLAEYIHPPSAVCRNDFDYISHPCISSSNHTASQPRGYVER